MWENGRLIDLNTFVPAGSSLQQLVGAFNINDRGEIVGLGVPPGVDPKDVFTLGHVFALIPCADKHGDTEGCEEGGSEDEEPQSRPTVLGPSRQMPSLTLSRRNSQLGVRDRK